MAYRAKATKRMVLKERTIQAGETADFTDKEAKAYKFALTDIEKKENKKGKGKQKDASPEGTEETEE
ncbi:hypothetical protein LC065_19985 (plasmid) [Halobacillus litoralis]|uniref:hypothetical protein n=1 Tax=Halobacillus litoralis TaxID=45668 RepID=UPI001CFEEB2A|nr:hypothetical protein [Halobacillus litoralis]WLR49589.1 hypothetical protein LC065_19985 [Halobacillus litoralis]